MSKKFASWLKAEIKQRKWKAADLARGMDYDSAAVSNLLNGKRHPAVETCRAVSVALNIPLEEVFRAADYLDEPVGIDPVTERIVHLIHDLEPDERQDVLDYVQFRHERLADRAKKNNHDNTGRGKGSAGKAVRAKATGSD